LMNFEPKRLSISVITIVKDNQDFLPRAVESVLSQSFYDYEYIIVNDGSTDGTKDIIENYERIDNRVIAKHISQNVGRAMARNAGLEIARGRYVLFLDSDDYLSSIALDDLYRTAEHDDTDIVFAGIKAFNQSSRNMIKKHYTDQFINHERHKFCLDEYPELVNNHTIIGRLYKNSFLKRRNIRFADIRKNGEDISFAFYTAFYAECITMIPQKKLYYYNMGNFLSTANELKIYDARDNIIETLVFTRKNGSKDLVRKVEKKVAIYVGDLRRAMVVFGLGAKLKEFLPTLVPLIEDISEDVLSTLSHYNKNFVMALVKRDLETAISLFKHKIRNES